MSDLPAILDDRPAHFHDRFHQWALRCAECMDVASFHAPDSTSIFTYVQPSKRVTELIFLFCLMNGFSWL
jgi:hypothetical protein